MQKIVIENFMAIRHAEIEVNKVLVLIGEQASGKSTIAKLIYFFKSLRDEMFSYIYNYEDDKDIDYDDFELLTRQQFYIFFGIKHDKFKITYYYNTQEDIYIELLRTSPNGGLRIDIDTLILSNEFKSNANILKKTFEENRNLTNLISDIHTKQFEIKNQQILSELVNNTFNCPHDSLLYIIAGRNVTVSYSESFQKFLYANIKSKIIENKRNKEQTLDEILMIDFIDYNDRIKDFLKKYVDFRGLIDFYSLSNNNINKATLNTVYQNIEKILKGKYKIDNQGEKILLSNRRSVHLNNASSGQQESIRILQDIFLALIEQQKVFRIIEEPEAHLFPEAQKLMIELLAILVNADDDNQVIITTHSPYVLTVFNNLLFANRVIEKNPDTREEVSKFIDSQSLISADDFAAYSLNPSQADENGNDYCVNLVNERTQVIDQNYLDTVSEELSNDFRTLYDLHTKSFARK